MTNKQVERNFQEIWKLFKKTDKEFEKTRRTVEETSRAVNSLTGKWSKFVEGLIAPAAERLFKERGIEIDKVYQRVKSRRNGKEMEVDILAINGEYGVLIEAKSTLKVEDIKEHIERLKKFKIFFPEYLDRKVVGAVGGIVIDEDSDKYAYKSGLFVITESGKSVRILNDKKFKPKIW
jgi:predicted AAA+ superfamily ATPase